ncbi:M20/M25/M40 family metallo-hydrolase [Caballeronia novacaledonica]|uniref:M20/M25/M40 family metallo-hydrolase n=1 Tax=Caballeronia novacaledonica TaxID=1544861 RepID=A0AA37MKF4_9BURK|nr:M20/M25/M40 family metallo-hydrolase [Caballeronia novacaledonica]GJH30853.1 M20/M25/M40 family metallo-hydrolase [Caballeronia novacaledonica]
MQADVHVAQSVEVSDQRRALAHAVAASSQEVVDLARALVAEPSPYPPGDTHAVARRIEAMLAGSGVEITRYGTLPHVMNLVVRVRGMRPGRRLVFNGHLDTFPLVDADRWSADPNGEARDGKLYGLGVSDMKGGIAAIVFALRHLASLRDTLPGEVVATFVGDEESMGTEGAGYLLNHVPEASGDAMISADTGSPVVLRFGEKGMIWLRLDASGKSAHAAHVHRGISAIERLLDAIQDLRTLRDHPVDAPADVLAEIANAGPVSEELSGRGESDVLRRVTVTFGTVQGGRLSNLVADQACATADIRLPVGVSVAQIEARINAIVARHEGVSVEITRRYEPNWTSPDHEIVQRVRRNCSARLGIEPVVNMRVGASDARHYRMHGVPTVVCGLTAHNMGSFDEHVHIDELCALAEIYALTAFDYLHGI